VRAYLLKRLMLIPVTLIGITFITFIVMKMAPGDPAKILRAQAAGQSMQATQANIEALENWKKERHLDKPWVIQYLYWLRDLGTFDLGRSLMVGRERVSHKIFGKFDVDPGRGFNVKIFLAGLLGLCALGAPFFAPRGRLSRGQIGLACLGLAVASAGMVIWAFGSAPKFTWGRVWVTLAYNLVAFVLIYVVALPVGILCAAKQFSVTDRVLTIVVFLLYSLPSFWIGTLLIAFVTGPDHWWARHLAIQLPTTGYYGKDLGEVPLGTWLWETAQTAFLPIVCMTYAGFAFLSRQMRSSLLEQIRQDFVRTARAKGLHERVVILRHATRNALIPIVTLFGTLLPAMIAGSVIIEQLFSIPGMGQLFFTAVQERDYNVIMGIEVVSALLTLFGILVSDILYVVVNPTIAYD